LRAQLHVIARSVVLCVVLRDILCNFVDIISLSILDSHTTIPC
jgi:hypothetical protein